MVICANCGGSGGSYGGYKPCYRCGGSGQGGFTDVACMACGGSGQSTDQYWNMCGNCAGSGTVPDPVQNQRQSVGQQDLKVRTGSPKTRTDWNAGIVFVVGVYAGGNWLIEIQGFNQDWVPYAIAVVPASIAAALWRVILVLTILGGVAFAILSAR